MQVKSLRSKVKGTDKDGKTIRVKASLGRELFGEIGVLRKCFDAEYLLDIVFNSDLFKNGSYLIIK